MELGQRSQVCHLLVGTRTRLSPRVMRYQPGSTGVGGEAAGEGLIAGTGSRAGVVLAARVGCPAALIRLAQKKIDLF